MANHVVIIGAGPGGYVAAVRAAQLGAEVTVIEKEHLGGTCLNRGCIPSKIMKTTADLLERLQKAHEHAVEIEGHFRADMKALAARKTSVVHTQREGIHKLLDHHRIRYLQGRAVFEGPNRLTVTPNQGGAIKVPWDRLILATGARPLNVPSFPFDGERILSSDHALELEAVPEAVAIVGGGVIGSEFAFILSALGAKVTVVEAMDRLLPLPSVDEDCAKTLQREMKKRKIACHLNYTVEAIENRGQKVRVALRPCASAQEARERPSTPLFLEADKVLVCVGRAANTANMGLERLGVKMDEKGWIIANERMETNISGVYAIGDALGPSKVMLAHVASAEGLVSAENASGGNRIMDYAAVPGAIFTMPEVANVGLTETQARALGRPVRADTVLFRNLGKAQVMGEIAGLAKIVSESESGRILGVHIVGPHATDLIAEGTLAVKARCTVQDLAETIHAHPTLAEIIAEASFKAMDQPLHG